VSHPKFVTAALLCASLAVPARADVITDWNAKTSELIAEARMGTPPAVRLMALTQTAAYGAANAVAGTQAGSVEAAVAAAHRAVLSKLLPAQQEKIDAAYRATLDGITDENARKAGITAGEQAATQLFARRAADMIQPERYRPHVVAGAYVPTVIPAVTTWAQRKPWLMTSAAQFRPGPPPELGSATWVRDYEEVRTLGSRTSDKRTAEQTEVARFWDFSLPAIYFGVVRSVADQPGRDVVRNALLYAQVAQAMDDALIAVFDAKYHYNFWRPVTAIRNGDADGHDGTQRDPAWASLIEAPMHPEYPSGHGILAGAVAAVLKADLGTGPTPVLATSSPTAKGATRRWSSLDAFVREVGDARVWAGIHFRTAVDVGAAMGQRIGELAVARLRLGQ
jgi:hypothetical protein